MQKTKFSSYCLNGIADGCKYCIKGEKLVLFITGKCPVKCWYCSLSKKRKDIDKIWANERECKNVKDVISEVKESNATSAGITGGDPLLFFERTIRFAKALKKEFKNFHMHIYLPTLFVTKEKLQKLSKYVDEVRFHPLFLSRNLSEKDKNFDIEKIKLALLFWKKQNIGIEMPCFPERKKEIWEFIKKLKNYIGFVNLNEFEISETNYDIITKNYKLNKDGYTIADSKKAGLWIIRQAEKEKLKLKIHLCTAETKNWHQYKNRLKLHKIYKYGYRTPDGIVRYFAIYAKNVDKTAKELKKFKEIYVDKNKNRIILDEKIVPGILKLKKYKIARVEEYPTFDKDETQFEFIN